jgi:hypothetical protein
MSRVRQRLSAEVIEDGDRLSVRLLMQTADEAEVEAFLDPARYVPLEEDSPAGYRNGRQFRPGAGPVGRGIEAALAEVLSAGRTCHTRRFRRSAT